MGRGRIERPKFCAFPWHFLLPTLENSHRFIPLLLLKVWIAINRKYLRNTISYLAGKSRNSQEKCFKMLFPTSLSENHLFETPDSFSIHFLFRNLRKKSRRKYLLSETFGSTFQLTSSWNSTARQFFWFDREKWEHLPVEPYIKLVTIQNGPKDRVTAVLQYDAAM